jgi:hypothetical protein
MAENATQQSDVQILTDWAGITAVNLRPSQQPKYGPFLRFKDALDSAMATALAPLLLNVRMMQNDLDTARTEICELKKMLVAMDKRHIEQCTKG